MAAFYKRSRVLASVKEFDKCLGGPLISNVRLIQQPP